MNIKKDKEIIRRVINGIYDNEIMTVIIRELSVIKMTNARTNKQVLSWARRVEAQRVQSPIMNSLNEVKECDKLKIVKNATRTPLEDTHRQKCPQNICADTVVAAIPKTMPGLWEEVHRMQ